LQRAGQAARCNARRLPDELAPARSGRLQWREQRQ
jgi:hypothetical protein